MHQEETQSSAAETAVFAERTAFCAELGLSLPVNRASLRYKRRSDSPLMLLLTTEGRLPTRIPTGLRALLPLHFLSSSLFPPTPDISACEDDWSSTCETLPRGPERGTSRGPITLWSGLLPRVCLECHGPSKCLSSVEVIAVVALGLEYF